MIPQLMPLFWVYSIVMISFLLMSLMILYSINQMEDLMFLNKNKNSDSYSSFSLKW